MVGMEYPRAYRYPGQACENLLLLGREIQVVGEEEGRGENPSRPYILAILGENRVLPLRDEPLKPPAADLDARA